MHLCEDGTLAHHWIIEPVSGKPTVRGVCKRCGLERLFPASGDDDAHHWKPHVPGMGRSQPEHPYY